MSTNFSMIDIPIGVRYYYYLNNNSKIFVNALVNLSLVLDADNLLIKRSNFADLAIEQSIGTNVLFGLGYKYQKFGLEARFSTYKNTLNDFVNRESKYAQTSVIFSYKLL